MSFLLLVPRLFTSFMKSSGSFMFALLINLFYSLFKTLRFKQITDKHAISKRQKYKWPRKKNFYLTNFKMEIKTQSDSICQLFNHR